MLRLSCFSLCGCCCCSCCCCSCCCCSCCCCCVKTELKTLPCFISPPLMTSLSCPPFSTEQFSLCPPHLEQFYNISFTFQSRMVFGRATFLLLSLVFPAAFSYRVSTEEVTVTNFKCLRLKLTILQKWSPSYFNHRYFSGPSASDYPTYIAPKVSFLNKTCSLSMF